MVHYLVRWGRPADRLFDITIRFTAPADDPRLLLPVWRPGRYLLQNYAANVRDWSADGRELRKDGKSSWVVSARKGEEVAVTYRFFAGILDAGSSFLDENEAYFNPTNLFMLVEGLREDEHRLTVAAPADWRIETQLPRASDEAQEEQTFVARDYDHLLDSPVVASAQLERLSFTVRDARIHLVFHGSEGIDTDAYVEPVRKIVEEQARLFGDLPVSEYRFLYHLRDKWHGVEHEDSCSIVGRRVDLLGSGPGDAAFEKMLSITAHEFFHVWNVKRIVPAAFSPYDYWRETPTRLLWAMEGVTSYFGDLTLVRSGIWTPDKYAAHLAVVIELLESQPARQHLSLAQASFDGWLSDPAQMHDHANAWLSFYTKGELVAMLLDLTIRQATGGERSLDHVMRLLWSEYGVTRRGLEEDGFERAVSSVADVGDFFRRYVEGTEPLPYAELLAHAGIEVSMSRPSHASIGAKLRQSGGLLMVDAAIRGGAGADAGLLAGDEIVALDGVRTSDEATLAQALRALPLGGRAELLVARAGSLLPLRVEGRPDPRPKVSLKITGESALRERWLQGER